MTHLFPIILLIKKSIFYISNYTYEMLGVKKNLNNQKGTRELLLCPIGITVVNRAYLTWLATSKAAWIQTT